MFNWLSAVAASDVFPGDTAIYTHPKAGGGVAANVLFLVDSSLTMHSPSDDGDLSRIETVVEALRGVVDAQRAEFRFGLMELGRAPHGGELLVPVGDVASSENFAAFTSGLNGLAEESSADGELLRPLAEALFDAHFYFDRDRTSTSMPLSETEVAVSPLEFPCQKQSVILLSSGDPVGDSSAALSAAFPEFAVDPESDSAEICRVTADAVARMAYADDLSAAFAGRQNLTTHTLLLSSQESALLQAVAEVGHGLYRQATSADAIRCALEEMLSNLLLDVSASFTTPTLPVSPENRVYSGSRVYLGFFKPVSQRPWIGNLKKFALNSRQQLLDSTGALALCSDLSASTPGCENVAIGGIRNDALSFWSSGTDGGRVDAGGVGELLLVRGASRRNLYSNLSDNGDLTAAENAFELDNLTAAQLGYADAEQAQRLIHYLHGSDAYDEDGDGERDETREWILGDILHSQPAVVHYHTYRFTADNEADAAINQSVIFVGANDGMLHAFRDADGEELWAFIPDNLLPELSALTETSHVPLLDGSVVVYRYDHDRDGNVGPGAEQAIDDQDLIGRVDNGSDDRVVLLFGERRGGGAYYALDVTLPTAPKFLWKLDSRTVDGSGNRLFSALGESWSEPTLALVRVGGSVKVAAFIGGGYAKAEDSRFGPVDGFPGLLQAQEGAGTLTSAEELSVADMAMPGRGVSIFALANCNAQGIPQLSRLPEKIWGTTFADDSSFARAVPAQVTVLDSNYDGYVDRMYLADLGGRLWRFNLSDPEPSRWSGDILFTQPADAGRKVFYRPSVVQRGDSWWLAFGSGDRAHPLNTAVADRFYLLKDQGQTTASAIDEDDLVNVTSDLLQADGTTAAERQELLERLGSVEKYGWYIDLDRRNQAEQPGGEKVVSDPIIFNNRVYFTTYLPDAETALSCDPCVVGNPGRSMLYALNVWTGEAAFNFYLPNDDEEVTAVNERALDPQGKILRREDRGVVLGEGMTSGAVVVFPSCSDASLLSGVGGVLLHAPASTGGAVYPLYWKEW